MPSEKKMGRPVIGKPKDKRLQVVIDEDSLKKLDSLCQKNEISRSEYIRQLIRKAK